MSRQDSTKPSPVSAHLSSLLLEIGTEEIPARFLSPALRMLKENAESLFGEYLIESSEIKTYATPRRLIVLVEGIPPVQKDRVKEVFGPAKKAAFDEKGNPTKAALGFAQSQGVKVADLAVKRKEKGEYVVALIQQKGIDVKDLLHEVLRKLILSLNFPKSMRWGSGNLRFVRPIHWILALFDGVTIPFDIDGIKSGNFTKGHRFLSPGTFVVKEIPFYLSLLENNYVIADQDERRKLIERGITSLASSVEGKALRDESLIETVTYLVEYPVPVLCEFSPDYLDLPKELLITVMKDHQKYFAVEDEKGKLKNYFIVISNTKNENSEIIKTGAERVIKARFEDASFYYEEDLKKPLHSRVEDLKRVTFHDRLGSLYEKTERIVKLASFLSDKISPHKKKQIERAAWLCKTDLISGVVGEFPELQGLMGKYYALHDGEDKEVANAIFEQYLPSYSGGGLPETDEGSVLGLSDKIDNIVSFFAIGLTPTGSEDPFALRRQALGVIAILMEKGYGLTLREIVEKAEENLSDAGPSLTDEVLNFFAQRIEPLLSGQNYDVDIIQSVIHLVDSALLREIRKRAHDLSKFMGEKERDYNSFLLAVKRINNIIPKTEIPAPMEYLLLEPREKTLYGEILTIKPSVHTLIGEGRYFEALASLSALTESINDFFDKVLVMDKREEIKLNRFALLKEIWAMTSMVADFSKLKERA